MPIDLRNLFIGLQKQLEVHLETEREIVAPPGAKGATAEANWKAMLDDHLPSRYQVSKAFVIDSSGGLSEEIDLVIHDRQYSPLLFNRDGALYVPAESVYAVLEVKQELDKGTVEYAGNKAGSVRALKRTSVPVPHAGGVFEPRKPFEILAGIVALESSWKPPFGDSLGLLLQSEDRDSHDPCHQRAHDDASKEQPEDGVAQPTDRGGHDLADLVLRYPTQDTPLPRREGGAGPHHLLPLLIGPGHEARGSLPCLRRDRYTAGAGEHLRKRPIGCGHRPP